MSYPIPVNEADRLQALYDLRILDTPPDPLVSRVCEEAAAAFDVPIALVSLIDRDRQWFKANVGLTGVCQTNRDVSFCNYAILQDEPLVVPDAQADERFASNPLVVGPPFIRFYAGAPIFFGDGIRLGTLCLIDTKPRSFSQEDRRRLEMYAERVLGCLWVHDTKVNSADYEFAEPVQGSRNGGSR